MSLRVLEPQILANNFADVVRNSAESLVYTDNARSLNLNGPDNQGGFGKQTTDGNFGSGASPALSSLPAQ